MEYKEENVVQFAKALDDKAELMLFTGTILGFIKGLVIGASISLIEHTFVLAVSTGADTGTLALGIGAILSFFGYRQAAREGLTLRFQAHSIMCNVQIERNTRPPASMAIETQPAPVPVTGSFPLA